MWLVSSLNFESVSKGQTYVPETHRLHFLGQLAIFLESRDYFHKNGGRGIHLIIFIS